MKDRITNVEVKDFLVDFKLNSETFVLEEGSKEISDLEKVAEARGYSIKNSKDLGLFKTVYAFTDKRNKNGAVLPKKELLAVLPQIIGKPISVNHDRNHVVGHYIDYKFITKSSKIMVWAVFYKSNFEDLYKEAKRLFKEKKLFTSFEIWSPKDQQKRINADTYEMHQIEIAGGALLFDEEPAFDGADVLSMAKKSPINNMELVYASKHKESELITSETVDTIETVQVPKEEFKAEENPQVVPTTKITCNHCQGVFEKPLAGDIKCPKCFSILDVTGKILYPPQIKNFEISCPSCKNDSWLILSQSEKTAVIRCRYCPKTYKLEFAEPASNEFIKKLKFVSTGQVRCHQCNTMIYYSGISGAVDKSIKCTKCGLEFSFDLSNNEKQRIKTIEETDITKVSTENEKTEKKDKSSEEGRQKENMNIPKEIVEKVLAEDKIKKEAKKTEHKDEAKVEVKPTPEPEVKVEEVVKELKVICKSCNKEFDYLTQTESRMGWVKCPNCKHEVNQEGTPAKVEEVKESPKEKVKEKASAEVPKEKYGKTKALRKAILKMRELKKASDAKSKKFIAGIKKTVAKLIASLENIENIQASADKTVKFYKANATKIVGRRLELEETTLTDEEILNDDKFELAKVKRQAMIITAKKNSENNEDVGNKNRDEGWYSKKREDINKQAFDIKK